MKFPDDWQEIVIENYEEKHRADVKTMAGVVIEFQNSSISTSTIRVREDFYGEMVWVVNARDFSDHLNLRSVVNSHLRELEREYREKARYSNYSDELFLKELNKDLAENSSGQKDRVKELNRLTERSENLKDLHKLIESVSKAVFNSWKNETYYSNYLINNALSVIEAGLHKEYKKMIQIQKSLLRKSTELKNELNLWSNFRDFEFEGTVFKRVSFSHVKGKDFKKVIAIEKKTLHTFLPTAVRFHSIFQFELYQYKEREFEFGFNPSELLQQLSHEIEEVDKELSDLKIDDVKIVEEIRRVLDKDISGQLSEIDSSIKNYSDSLNDLIRSENIFLERRDKYQERMSEERDDYFRQLEKEEKEERFKIMREKKGLYTFTWKHERKTWLAANCRVFFDIGKEYLLERKRDTLFKKISIEDFVQYHTAGIANAFPG